MYMHNYTNTTQISGLLYKCCRSQVFYTLKFVKYSLPYTCTMYLYLYDLYGGYIQVYLFWKIHSQSKVHYYTFYNIFVQFQNESCTGEKMVTHNEQGLRGSIADRYVDHKRSELLSAIIDLELVNNTQSTTVQPEYDCSCTMHACTV